MGHSSMIKANVVTSPIPTNHRQFVKMQFCQIPATSNIIKVIENPPRGGFSCKLYFMEFCDNYIDSSHLAPAVEPSPGFCRT